jgi:hypothetical protein
MFLKVFYYIQYVVLMIFSAEVRSEIGLLKKDRIICSMSFRRWTNLYKFAMKGRGGILKWDTHTLWAEHGA